MLGVEKNIQRKMLFLTSSLRIDSQMSISQGKWSYNRSSLSSLLWDIDTVYGFSGSNKSWPRDKDMCAYGLFGCYRKHHRGSTNERQASKVASNKRCIIEQVPAVSNWGSNVLGISETQHKDASVILTEGHRHPGFLSSSLLHSLVES